MISFGISQPLNMTVIASLQMPLYHVVGNHDFSVTADYKEKVYETLGMPSAYYTKSIGNWEFIFLDTNVITSYAYIPGSADHKFYTDLRREKFPFAKGWNGGFGDEQLEWLAERLADAESSGRKVALFYHAPAFTEPAPRGGAIDGPALLDVISRYPDTVKFVLAGHQHDGGYRQIGNTHHLTIKGQIEADSSTYAIVEITDTTVTVSGFGKQESHVWEL